MRDIALENESQKATETPERHTPTSGEIDTLLGLYLDADQNVENAIEKRDIFGEQIEVLIGIHGYLPPRAKKSKRIQGEEYKATLSQSHGVEVDSPAVLRLHKVLKDLRIAHVFRKLFRREEIFVLADGAQEVIAKLARKMPGFAAALQLHFSATLRIESRSQTLKVEPLKPEAKK